MRNPLASQPARSQIGNTNNVQCSLVPLCSVHHYQSFSSVVPQYASGNSRRRNSRLMPLRMLLSRVQQQQQAIDDTKPRPALQFTTTGMQQLNQDTHVARQCMMHAKQSKNHDLAVYAKRQRATGSAAPCHVTSLLHHVNAFASLRRLLRTLGFSYTCHAINICAKATTGFPRISDEQG